MHVRYPIGLRNVPRPGIRTFGILFMFESVVRSLLSTVITLLVYDLLRDSRAVSLLFSTMGLVGLAGSFTIPWIIRRVGRRWCYTLGGAALIAAALGFMTGTLAGAVFGVLARVYGTACLNISTTLYIMQYIERRDLTRSEPFRLQMSAIAWALGPTAGVWLYIKAGPAWPFVASIVAALILLTLFWLLRLVDSPVSARPQAPVPNPLYNIRRFLRQPRLRLAWVITAGRSCWWVFFFVYTPIYMVEAGEGELAGSLVVSAGNAMLLLTPVFGKLSRHHGIRLVIMVSFVLTGVFTVLAGIVFLNAGWVAVFLLAGSVFCVALDAVGNVPFMRSARSFERPAMTTVFRTYLDFSETFTPILFAVVLTIADLRTAFIVFGVLIMSLVVVAHFLPRSMR